MTLSPSLSVFEASPLPQDMPAVYRLGMPQLCLGGLSETWLLKELGHRHWMLLAFAAGHAVPAFRDGRGAPVYAAFSAVRIDEADFASLGENDLLTVDSSLSRLSRTRFRSRHRLTAAGRPVGMVDMVSTFVTRREAGRNRSIARARSPACRRCRRAGRPMILPRSRRRSAPTPAGDTSAFLRTRLWPAWRAIRRRW
ncbi:Pnap_2097 family protein [Methylobrevis pamukkalensis]|uniref:Uncharacterized protein n=1 Tax=Methylobrevis pamukkalensis TaxID=1439726 RepID=A0A1E3H5F4_9HYPH|nr:Pnap_2097 family protein [Methylobrevis pamukkalensis]ODN71026.1 hypothetical protein A6302_01660 [Methylobrevis pamukkalensis]